MIKCFRYFHFVISLVGWNCFGFERLWALYVTLQSLYPAYFTIRVPFLYGTTSLNSRNSLYCTSQFTISLKRVSLELRIRVSACKCMQLFKTDIRATINQKKFLLVSKTSKYFNISLHLSTAFYNPPSTRRR